MRKLFVITSERCCQNSAGLDHMFWKKHITCSLHRQRHPLLPNGESTSGSTEKKHGNVSMYSHCVIGKGGLTTKFL